MAFRSISVFTLTVLLGIACHATGNDSAKAPFTRVMSQPPAVSKQHVGIERASLDIAIRTRLQPWQQKHPHAAMVVTVDDGHSPHIVSAGSFRPDVERNVGQDTVFLVGSITKALTGILLADLIVNNAVNLDDSAQSALPDLTLPAFHGEPIRIRHLATHTSGLPWMPTNWVTVDEGPYTREMFRNFLATHQLDAAPGLSFQYGNVGFGLLGEALGNVHGGTFAEALSARVLSPLGMANTRMLDDEHNISARAQAYDEDNSLVPLRRDEPRLAGCCAMGSTARDLIMLSRAVLHPPASKTGDAINVATTPVIQASNDLDDQYIGLGWFIRMADGVRWMPGRMKGYRSAVLADRHHDLGVVVLAAAEDMDATALAFGVLRDATRLRSPARPESRITAVPASAQRTDVVFGGRVRLIGWDAPGPVAPGDDASLTLYLRCEDVVPDDWQLFVHGVTQASAHRLHGDHFPSVPTDECAPGDIVKDTFLLSVPSAFPSGDVQLWLGFYLPSGRISAVGEPGSVDDRNRARGPLMQVIMPNARQ